MFSSHLGQTHTGIVLRLYLGACAPKVSHSVILYVCNLDFSEVAINRVLESTVATILRT